MTTKVCFKCGKEKPINEFYKHSMMADGRLNKCKECTKKDVQENYRKNRKHYIAYEKERSQRPQRKQRQRETYRRLRREDPERFNAYREKHLKKMSQEEVRERQRRSRKINPLQYKARMVFRNAVRAGKIKRPSQCSKCGATGTVHGHHVDYTKPLDVVWLCPACHGQAHWVQPEHAQDYSKKEEHHGFTHCQSR